MVDAYAGKDKFALIGIESTFNTAAATITADLGITEVVAPEWSNNNIAVRSIGDRQVVDNIAGVVDFTSGVEGTLNSGAILELFFGNSEDANTGTDYKHIFVDTGSNLLLNTSSSFSVLENYSNGTDITYQYTGCKFNTLDISVERNNTLRFSSELLMSSVTTGATAGTSVQTSTTPMSFAQATLSTGTDGAEAVVGLTRQVEINMTHNIDPADVKAIGSRENQCLVEKNLDVTVSFRKTFADKTEAERFLGGSTPADQPEDTSLILQVTNGVALGSGRTEFYIKLTGGQYNSVSYTGSQQDVIEESFEYVGGKIAEIYFTDSVASYF